MTLESIALTFDFLGTVLIGVAIFRVHKSVGKEHEINKGVLKTICLEQGLTITGLILITIGFILNFI